MCSSASIIEFAIGKWKKKISWLGCVNKTDTVLKKRDDSGRNTVNKGGFQDSYQKGSGKY